MIVRMYTGPDGKSHFEDLKMPVAPEGRREPGPDPKPLEPASGVIIKAIPRQSFHDWHNAPGRVYGIFLQGQYEVEVGDGSVRRFGPGDVILGEDLTGQGHRTRTISKEPVVLARVQLA